MLKKEAGIPFCAGDGAVTVSFVEPYTVPNAAAIEVLPDDKFEARPVEVMVATFNSEEFQVTYGVKTRVVPQV